MRFTTAEYQAYLARTAPKQVTAKEGVEREADLHDDIRAECRRRGWIAIHSRMDKPTTSAIGDPDFVILAENGKTYLVEAKSRTGKLRPEQLALRVWAHRLGHTIHLVRSMQDFHDATKEL